MSGTKKMANRPLVSILMNCFNGELYLEEALISVIKQSYSNWELIFWNNKSTDRSLEIASKYKDKRIKIAQQKVDHVLQGKIKGKYGIGDKRTLKEFANLSGVDYTNKSYQKDKATWQLYEKGGLELGKKFE